ncbi:hypothetical protein GGX14DRAFT_399120 [Mycena pura]|uniref:Uncharacterized protein n=1 Tax=Mycena pura TaxID=153505 RepID=A0AAD6V5L9_9AGAR|nr:hypothetical protein GGX14DRAFT_399120 [Mycena pura]
MGTLARGAAHGCLLLLATLLPPLVALRPPSKAVIFERRDGTTLHVSHRHRVLATQTPRRLDREAKALRMTQGGPATRGRPRRASLRRGEMEHGAQEEEDVGVGRGDAGCVAPGAGARTHAHAHVQHTQQGRFEFKAPASAGPSVRRAPRALLPTPVMDGFDGLAYAARAWLRQHATAPAPAPQCGTGDLGCGLFDTAVNPADYLSTVPTHARDEVGAGAVSGIGGVMHRIPAPRASFASASLASLAGRRLTGSTRHHDPLKIRRSVVLTVHVV